MTTGTTNGRPKLNGLLLARLIANATTLPRELGRRSGAGDARRDVDRECGS